MTQALNTNPVVSVIVPCYNQAQYLPEALQSVLDQEYPYWECIIINDGSPDETKAVAEEWLKKDKRFRYFEKENTGVCDTRNIGVEQAIGEYIIPLDGDDKISPLYIKDAINVFKEDPEVKLVYSDTILFGDKNKEIVNADFVFDKMLTENQIFNSAIFRKADFIDAGGYNLNMHDGIEDWDFYLSLIKPTDKVVKINAFHYYYRIKEISRSMRIFRETEKNNKMLLQMFKNHASLYLEYFNPIRDRIEADYYKQEVKSYQNCAEYKIGKIICAPYRILQRIFRKLFAPKNN